MALGRMTGRASSGVVLLASLSLLSCVDEATYPDLSQFPPMHWSVTLSPANVVPPVTSPGSGTATFEWDGTRLSYVIHAQNMVRINAAHIHAPATATENADIVLHLFVPFVSTGSVSGELARGAAVAGSPLFAQGDMATLLARMRDGRTYLMVHTDANPDGEIRGQITLQPRLQFPDGR